MKIKPMPAYATGEWVQVSSNSQGQEATYHVGLTSTDSTITTTEKERSLTAAMEVQVKYLAVKTEFEVSGTVKKSITTAVSNTATSQYDQTIEYPCYPPKVGDDAKYGASLYQWTVSNGTVTSYDKVFICRTGVDWTTPPKCPHGACIDANCDTCQPWH